MLGNIEPSPAATCSWLRSSTAPSESTPASISGTSASTEPPAVRLTICKTASSPTALAATADIPLVTTLLSSVGARTRRCAYGVRKPRASPLPPRSFGQSAGSTAKLRHAGSSVLLSAATDISREITPDPDASARTSAPCRAAYPTSPTAPQFTLCPHTPLSCRHPTIVSSHALAAECGACPGDPTAGRERSVKI